MNTFGGRGDELSEVKVHALVDAQLFRFVRFVNLFIYDSLPSLGLASDIELISGVQLMSLKPGYFSIK